MKIKNSDKANFFLVSTLVVITVLATLFNGCKKKSVNQSPIISITSPANGSSFTAPASVNIIANASDPDGSISKVEFYNGSTLLATSTAAPYSYSLANVAAGTYTYTAKAYDNLSAI
ncbi:MAG TPA: Ig-like domain-containing protein, partial [Cytophagaceae bacterium]|nr:Ig-like domain-containing protein [Cytophagaceae bacterium]